MKHILEILRLRRRETWGSLIGAGVLLAVVWTTVERGMHAALEKRSRAIPLAVLLGKAKGDDIMLLLGQQSVATIGDEAWEIHWRFLDYDGVKVKEGEGDLDCISTGARTGNVRFWRSPVANSEFEVRVELASGKRLEMKLGQAR